MGIVITKSSRVSFKQLTPALSYMLYVLEKFARFQNYDALVITSINDGKHSENSRHYRDEAFDLRAKNIPIESRESFRQDLESYLNNNELAESHNKFRVLHEHIGTDNEHFHIQIRKGMKYP